MKPNTPNQFPNDDYVYIPHKFLERSAKTEYNADQAIVILCIVRYTWGERIQWAESMIERTAKLTNIPRKRIKSALHELTSRKIISRHKDNKNTYSINENYNEWK